MTDTKVKDKIPFSAAKYTAIFKTKKFYNAKQVAKKLGVRSDSGSFLATVAENNIRPICVCTAIPTIVEGMRRRHNAPNYRLLFFSAEVDAAVKKKNRLEEKLHKGAIQLELDSDPTARKISDKPPVSAEVFAEFLKTHQALQATVEELKKSLLTARASTAVDMAIGEVRAANDQT